MSSLTTGGVQDGHKTIGNLDEPLMTRLWDQAARHGRSMEEEARETCAALAVEPAQGITRVNAIRARLAPYGGLELELPVSEPIREPAGFGA